VLLVGWGASQKRNLIAMIPQQHVPFEDSSRDGFDKFPETNDRRTPVELTNLSRSHVTNLSRSELTNLSGSDKTCLNPEGGDHPGVIECALIECELTEAEIDAYLSGSDDACHPEVTEPDREVRMAFLAEGELVHYLLSAVNADKTKDRRPIKPPHRSGMAGYAMRKRGGLTTYSRLTSCLRAVAVRALGDLTADARFTPSHADLSDALEDFAWSNYRDVIHVQEYGEPRPGGAHGWCFTDEDGVTSAASQAAEAALGTLSWSSWGKAELKRRQGVGGAKGHRGPSKVTEANLARLEALPEGLTVAQQGKRLRLKVATVKRLRRFPK